ncbi:MAG: hypothetical protein MJD61_16805 [Proteobacteria bacterium]|nr:hypothetical protein [Pseudomonadota bacterium]
MLVAREGKTKAMALARGFRWLPTVSLLVGCSGADSDGVQPIADAGTMDAAIPWSDATLPDGSVLPVCKSIQEKYVDLWEKGSRWDVYVGGDYRPFHGPGDKTYSGPAKVVDVSSSGSGNSYLIKFQPSQTNWDMSVRDDIGGRLKVPLTLAQKVHVELLTSGGSGRMPHHVVVLRDDSGELILVSYLSDPRHFAPGGALESPDLVGFSATIERECQGADLCNVSARLTMRVRFPARKETMLGLWDVMEVWIGRCRYLLELRGASEPLIDFRACSHGASTFLHFELSRIECSAAGPVPDASTPMDAMPPPDDAADSGSLGDTGGRPIDAAAATG